MRAILILKIAIGSLVLNYSSAFAHICELSGNETADIIKYNQCVADQDRETKINKKISGYEDEIKELVQDNIRLKRRLAKIKRALSTIISNY